MSVLLIPQNLRHLRQTLVLIMVVTLMKIMLQNDCIQSIRR